jgi:YVTN family beta-propeller protein
MRKIASIALASSFFVASIARSDSTFQDRTVRSTVDGGLVERDGKLIHAAGDSLEVPGKPLDIVATPDGSLLFAKSEGGLAVIDTKSFKVTARLRFKKEDKDGGSMFGLAVAPAADGNGWTVFYPSTGKAILQAKVAADGTAQWSSKIPVSDEYNLGIALSPDLKLAYVCMSAENTLGIIDLASGKTIQEIPVGVCPYGVAISPDGKTAYVTNYGGRPPASGQPAEKSDGTDVAVDERSIPNSGTVSRVNLQTRTVIGEFKTGLHPTQIVRDSAGDRYYIANANSDSVTVIDARANRVAETIFVRPDPGLPYGSIPNALSLSADDKTLYVANAGNDAVAVVSVDHPVGQKSPVIGFIPTGWFPGSVLSMGTNIYVANMKSGSITRVADPGSDDLKNYSKQVLAEEQVPRTLREMERAKPGVAAVPVPAHPGDPSVFKHVVYILKENKTYDQVLGDIGKGNSDPKLCVYGEKVTPNQHALANQFVLLDNYYCNGVNSSDGHQWATQGIIGEYFEKGSRTYDFGTDCLCYAGSDFIWDSCLLHGLSVRNYGEFDFPAVTSRPRTWFDVYRGWDKGQVTFKQSVQFQNLMNYTCRQYPGWDLAIPDACRLKVFLKEFSGFEQSGKMPDFMLVYLPQDHTSGTGQTVPTPRAMVADNDLATGEVVSAISKSPFWKNTVIFINEDDPQSGYDHVDGHRSFCLIASPYTKRDAIVSHFYNQTSVLHTMTRIMGLPPMNQSCAMAPTMEDCFTSQPDLRPYQAVPNIIPLDERNKPRRAMSAPEQKLADAVDKMDFTRPDRADEDKLNRLIWIASGRTEAYPVEFAGPHGRGLSALHLKLDKTQDTDGDGDGD